MSYLKKIGLRVLTVAMIIALPILKYYPSDEGEAVMTRWPQVVAALILFLGLVAWALNFGKIFVYWFADWVVDFIYGARGSFVEKQPILTSKQEPEKSE